METCQCRSSTCHCVTEALKIAQIGSARRGAISLSNQLGMSSGPGDLLSCIRESLIATCQGSIMYSEQELEFSRTWNLSLKGSGQMQLLQKKC